MLENINNDTLTKEISLETQSFGRVGAGLRNQEIRTLQEQLSQHLWNFRD
jgi:ATP-dependent DNA ligase